MKVCRRCVPYKKPKGADEAAARVSKSKIKVSMNKFLKQKVKNAKKTAKFEVKHSNNDGSTQTKELFKSAAQKPTEENGVNAVKQPEKPPEKSLVQVSPKQDTKMVHVSIKNGKVESSTSSDTLRNTFPPISTSNDKESSSKTHVLSTLQEKIVQSQPSVVFLKLKGLDSVTKQQAINSLTSQVDFGTQPVQSMIGVKKNKQKTTKNENEDKDKDGLQPEDKECDNTEETTEKKEGIKENEDEEKVANKEDVSLEEKPEKKDKIEGKKEGKEEDFKDENKPKHVKEIEMEKTQKALNDGESKTAEIKPAKPLKVPVLEPVRSSPRRDKNIVPPEKKKDSSIETKTATVSTRKRKGASESESESSKQSEVKSAKQSEETTNEKQSTNKTNDKAEAGLKRSTRKGRGMKRKDSECSNTDSDKKDKKSKVDDTKG